MNVCDVKLDDSLGNMSCLICRIHCVAVAVCGPGEPFVGAHVWVDEEDAVFAELPSLEIFFVLGRVVEYLSHGYMRMVRGIWVSCWSR